VNRREIAALAIWLELARLLVAQIDRFIMLNVGNPMVWLVGIAAIFGMWLLGRGRFTPEARARRRRDRSNRPLISRKRGPTVRLAVKTDKSDRDRKDR